MPYSWGELIRDNQYMFGLYMIGDGCLVDERFKKRVNSSILDLFTLGVEV
jgi:hypothetical protein